MLLGLTLLGALSYTESDLFRHPLRLVSEGDWIAIAPTLTASLAAHLELLRDGATETGKREEEEEWGWRQARGEEEEERERRA